MNASKLSSTEKTAIVLLALGEDVAAEIFRHMEPNEVKKVGAALSRVGRVSQETVDIVMQEFHQILTSNQPSLLRGDFDFTKNVIDKAFGNSEHGSSLKADLAQGNVKMSSLELADADTIYRIIANEHPQTMALVLAHAGSQKGGAILRLIPEALKVEVIKRVSQLDSVSPEIIMDLDEMIRREIEQMGISRKKIGGVEKAAAILNAMNQGRDNVLDRLEERDPDLSDSIRAHMFTFEDLAQVDDRGIQELLKAVDKSLWELALRGVSSQVSDAIYRNMSKRAANTLKEDIEARGPQKLNDVQDAQRMVLEKAFTLENQGKIILREDPKQKVV